MSNQISPPDEKEIQENIILRREILLFLYQKFRVDPTRPVITNDILGGVKAIVPVFNWNAKYLDMAGYAKLEVPNMRGGEGYPVANFMIITSRGIDLVENRAEFDERFPKVKVDQKITVHGNHTGHISGSGNIAGDIRTSQDFFNQIEKELKKQENLPEPEKVSLLNKVKDLTSHPVVSGLISKLLSAS